jgi:ABC-type multidrug transport system fused ATPase/permease subunit
VLRSVSSPRPMDMIEIDLSEGIDEPSSEKQQTKKKHFRRHRPLFIRLLTLNRPEWVYIIFGTIASMLAGATEPVVGIIFSSVYRQYANADLANQARETRHLALIIFALHIAGGFFVWATTWAFAISGERLTQRMRLIAFLAMLRQEIGWFDREENSVGALTTRLSADASALKVRIPRETTNRHYSCHMYVRTCSFNFTSCRVYRASESVRQNTHF